MQEYLKGCITLAMSRAMVARQESAVHRAAEGKPASVEIASAVKHKRKNLGRGARQVYTQEQPKAAVPGGVAGGQQPLQGAFGLCHV